MARAVERSPGSARTTKKSAKPKVDVETKLEALAAKTIADLMASKSDASDASIWKRAIAEFGKLMTKHGAAPTHNLDRFFAKDGVAIASKHRVVVKAAKPISARKAAWLALLKAAAPLTRRDE
jgi:hypothetical protein